MKGIRKCWEVGKHSFLQISCGLIILWSNRGPYWMLLIPFPFFIQNPRRRGLKDGHHDHSWLLTSFISAFTGFILFEVLTFLLGSGNILIWIPWKVYVFVVACKWFHLLVCWCLAYIWSLGLIINICYSMTLHFTADRTTGCLL